MVFKATFKVLEARVIFIFLFSPFVVVTRQRSDTTIMEIGEDL